MVARLGLSSHTVTIERNKSGKFSPLASGGSVRPEEALRYSAHWGWQWSTKQGEFEVTDQTGRVVWGPKEAKGNLAGNAWLDANAPRNPGLYKLTVKGTEFLPGSFGTLPTESHSLSRSFRVAADAPAIPGGSGFALPAIGGVFSSPWTIVLLLVGLLALGIVL
tara:strand:- start:1807 stop:2298 length:492 start_codon:yes stop_codon:yes gene_type:complete